MDLKNSELVEARVAADEILAAGRYPVAIAYLIEQHELKHLALVNRKGIHVLGQRYTDQYFGGRVPANDEIRGVIRILQDRKLTRFRAVFALEMKKANDAQFAVQLKELQREGALDQIGEQAQRVLRPYPWKRC